MEYLQSSVSKVLRKLLKKFKGFIPKRPKQKARKKSFNRNSIVIFIGIVFVIFGGINYHQTRRLSFSSVPQEVETSIINLDVPIEIIIPSINIDLKIDPGQIINGVWQTSEKNATFLNSSAVPGNSGNTVIYAHNKETIFGNLPYLSVGQEISIKLKSGKIFNYVVTEKYFVSPNRVDLVSPSNVEELTVYTCWGTFDSQRVVIKAIPKK